jgi:hypothetical protein
LIVPLQNAFTGGLPENNVFSITAGFY